MSARADLCGGRSAMVDPPRPHQPRGKEVFLRFECWMCMGNRRASCLRKQLECGPLGNSTGNPVATVESWHVRLPSMDALTLRTRTQRMMRRTEEAVRGSQVLMRETIELIRQSRATCLASRELLQDQRASLVSVPLAKTGRLS